MSLQKLKAVTFSYDDGVTQDRRLVELFNRYGLKCTFNLNSGKLGKGGSLLREGATVSHEKVPPEEVTALYAGHEVAAHTVNHPSLIKLSDEEIVREVEEDRVALSKLVGYEVVGMAYPNGTQWVDERVFDLVRSKTGIRYARTTTSTHNFDLQQDLIAFDPTVYHHAEFDKAFELAHQFLSMKADKPQILYIWGHAYEFDIHNTWDKMEELCKLLSGHEDVFYGTNREVLLEKYWE